MRTGKRKARRQSSVGRKTSSASVAPARRESGSRSGQASAPRHSSRRSIPQPASRTRTPPTDSKRRAISSRPISSTGPAGSATSCSTEIPRDNRRDARRAATTQRQDTSLERNDRDARPLSSGGDPLSDEANLPKKTC